LAAGAPPRTPLGELTVLPQIPHLNLTGGGEEGGLGVEGQGKGREEGKGEGEGGRGKRGTEGGNVREGEGGKGGMGMDPTKFGRKSTPLHSVSDFKTRTL